MSGIIDCEMHIGDEVFVHGYIDEIRNDTIIIRNVGGYFGTSRDEVFYYEEDGTLNADRKTENSSDITNICKTCKHRDKAGNDFPCVRCSYDDTMYEPKDEPQIFTWGKEVHEFCKMKCNKSKARSFDGNRFIVCGQSNDAICINLPACPLGKWITGKGYHILPMDEPQTEVCDDCIWHVCNYNKAFAEPQTCSVNGRPYDCGKCEYFRCTADEPQIIACPINERAEYWFYEDEPQKERSE